MLKINLKLTFMELNVLYMYSNQAFIAWSDPTNRPTIQGPVIQMAEHYERVRKQVYNWAERPRNKEYRCTLPVSLTCIYHYWLSNSVVTSLDQGSLVAKLDKALVDRHLKPQTLKYDS